MAVFTYLLIFFEILIRFCCCIYFNKVLIKSTEKEQINLCTIISYFIFLSYLDGLFGSTIKSYMLVHAPMKGGFLAHYPDFLAVVLVLVFAVVLVTGVQLSSKINMVIATINIVVILFIIGKFSKHF